MNRKYILHVEDDELNRDLFLDSINDWNAANAEAGKEWVLVATGSYDEAIQALDQHRFDCAIVDLRLPEKEDAQETPNVGNKLAKAILFGQGLPLAILSGHPAEIDEGLRDAGLVSTFDKGDGDGYENALGWLSNKWGMMTTLRAAKASIDGLSAEVFAKRLWPRWNAFSDLEPDNQANLIKIIARQYVSHIADIMGLDGQGNAGWHPFECYNVPSLFDDRAHTGDLFALDDSLWVVLSPQCDMATKKIANVLLAKCHREIENWPQNVETLKTPANEKKREKAESYFKRLVNQNIASSTHFLPPLPGEPSPILVSFGEIRTLSLEVLTAHLNDRVASISYPFVSNLVQRFGSFISRTGQPNIEVTHFAS
ncbi:hypothetical protein ASD52_36435 [Ensifer sp. Root142]|uniref:response regulator n=1 Tax=Ensifer sp. Root142 TaxID=1736461 RepID=UPI00070EB9E8|nr:response regulator [Ensifer sp. Root142]KQY62743.1 hypothetical protein ASD52_36435 [Ensifer sp. Root142]